MKTEPTTVRSDLGASGRGHEVHFYEESGFLVRRVADFLAPGIVAGEAVVMIATPKHTDLIEAELRGRGADVDQARAAGTFVTLDAVETMKQFMNGDQPDQRRFIGVVATAIEGARKQASVPIVRAFGEMVAVLWAQNRPQAALALEDLWNDLIGHHPLALLCGYPVDQLAQTDRTAISQRHTTRLASH